MVRKIYTENNGLIQTESISEDFYPPVHQVEVHGLIVSDTTINNEVTNASESTDAATAGTTGTTDTINTDENNSTLGEAGGDSNTNAISEDSTE